MSYDSAYVRKELSKASGGDGARVMAMGQSGESKFVNVPDGVFRDMVAAVRDDGELKALPRHFGGRVIAHMQVPHTSGTVKHQAIIICERDADEPDESPDFSVHHIGSDSFEKEWYGVSGVYDIKDIGDAFLTFQDKLSIYGAIPV